MTDDAVERLWRAAPDEFTGVRDALAKELRDEGRKDEAAEIKALKKPSLALWAVNQLASKQPRVVDDLIGLGQQVEAATAQAFRGEGPGAVRELDRQRRHAVADATAAAETLCAEAGHPLSAAMAARVSSTLDSAVLQEETRALLAAGRVATELDAAGFGGLEALDLGGGPSGEDENAAADDERAARERRRVEEREAEELRRAEAESERLEAVAADAETIAETARARAVAARQHADELAGRG